MTATNGLEHGGASAVQRPDVYCVIPRDLASALLDLLREHFRDDPVSVIVERRLQERRGTTQREADVPVAEERRRVRSREGRRVADRRALPVLSETKPLPRKARQHAERLIFLERVEPASQAAEDLDSARLVLSAQQGDSSAFFDLYQRYFDRIYKYARATVRDQDTAEDVVQTVFTNALAALPRFEVRPGHPVRAWLFRIARNAIITQFRIGQQHELMDQDELNARRARQPDPHWIENLHWLSDYEVALFVERLPLAQQQTLLLRYMLDLPTDQIAAVLDRTPQAIRLLEHRALRTLSARLRAVGRTTSSGRQQVRQPMRVRVKHAPVLRERRFALAFSRPDGRLGWGSRYR